MCVYKREKERVKTREREGEIKIERKEGRECVSERERERVCEREKKKDI